MASEQYGFVFAVLFLTLFAGFTAMIPVDLQGTGSTPDILIPVDPALTSDFTDAEPFTKSDFGGVIGLYYLYYDLGSVGNDFECDFYSATDSFSVGALVRILTLWFGGLEYCNFVSKNGTNYGTTVSFTDIDNDAEEGATRYELILSESGNSAGAFIFYYNTTTYTDSSDAWDNDELHLVHGVGFSPNTDIVSLLVGILFLQLPDVPVGINLLLASAPWASVVYIIWFIIKESLPFI